MKKMVNGDDEISEDALEERQIINEDDPRVNVSSRKIHCLMSVFQIELSCSTTSTEDRMPTNVFVNEMKAIRDRFLKLSKGKKMN